MYGGKEILLNIWDFGIYWTLFLKKIYILFPPLPSTYDKPMRDSLNSQFYSICDAHLLLTYLKINKFVSKGYLLILQLTF